MDILDSFGNICTAALQIETGRSSDREENTEDKGGEAQATLSVQQSLHV